MRRGIVLFKSNKMSKISSLGNCTSYVNRYNTYSEYTLLFRIYLILEYLRKYLV